MATAESLRPAFRQQLERLRLGPSRVLVAVSGGSDSLALLDLLAEAAGDFRLELVIAHVDHGIHPASAAVGERVRELAASYGLPSLDRRLELGSAASETVARAARYRALEAMRREAGADWIATAHHADDQAETVLMRVVRGSGPAGLAGMASRHGRLIRPLLSFRRADLARHVLSIGLLAWEDPANADPKHLRSWVRERVMPHLTDRLPDAAERLVRVAEQASVNRAGWDALLDLWPGLDYHWGREAASVALKGLEGADDNLLLCLVMALGRRGNFSIGLARATRVAELVRAGRSGSQVPLGLGQVAEIAFDRLRLIGSPVVLDRADLLLAGNRGVGDWASWRFTWQLAEAPERQERVAETAWFDPSPLLIRACRAGEKVMPLGGRGRRLIVRCLQDARVPRSRRGQWPALVHDGTVVWVPGVCRSDRLVPRPGAEALRVDAELT
jgi:tRNA(Ile)-lysidine synthase